MKLIDLRLKKKPRKARGVQSLYRFADEKLEGIFAIRMPTAPADRQPLTVFLGKHAHLDGGGEDDFRTIPDGEFKHC